MSHRYALDTLRLRGDLLFGWGWFLDEASPAKAIDLELTDVDGGVQRLACPREGTRPDLVEAYPQIRHAAAGGFMLQGRIRSSQRPLSAKLLVELADGRQLQLELPPLVDGTSGGPASRMVRLSQLVRNRDWAALGRRGREWLARHGAALLADRPQHPGRGGGAGHWVLFDHDMGGGANHFRQSKIAQWVQAGHTVVLVTPVLETLEYRSTRFTKAGSSEQRHPTLTACLQALDGCALVAINDLVSYDDPLQVLAWALQRKQAGAILRIYIHDFHAACPAWTLTSSDGRHCGVPPVEQCARCLPANRAAFLGMMPNLDIPAWRAAWSRALHAADEVIAFSRHSVGVLQRAHPQLESARVQVQPHSLDYLGPPRTFSPSHEAPMTIAVVGHISWLKGAEVVREMVQLIERERRSVRIVVVGTIDGVDPSPALRVTGRYRVHELPELLEREQVSVAFLPSIVHETFSYVTAELMHHGVPLAAFDLGAPAERLRGHPLGCIVSAVDARTALDEITAFHGRLSASAAPSVRGLPSGVP